MHRNPSKRWFISIAVVAAIPAAVLGVWPSTTRAATAQPRLLTVTNYAIMGGQSISNTGPTVINGNLAISPKGMSSVTGIAPETVGGPGVVNGVQDFNNANAINAQTDLVTTYNDAQNATPFVDMSGKDLGGLTLTPGVYHFSSGAQLTGTVTLDGQGSTNATFIFQIGSTLTTAGGSHVRLINGAGGCAVFWQVTSSATLGSTTDFQGNLVALTSITMVTGATVGVGGGSDGGRILARNGDVTLDTNIITPPTGSCTYVPSVGTPTPKKPARPPVPHTGGGA